MAQSTPDLRSTEPTTVEKLRGLPWARTGNGLTPLDALNRLYELQKLVD